MWDYEDAEWKSEKHKKLANEGWEPFAIASFIQQAINVGGVIDHVKYKIMVYFKKLK